MRILRTYNVEIELVEKVKAEGCNASDLINKLLSDYFNSTDPYKMTEKQLKEFIAKEEIKQEYEAKLSERLSELKDGT